MYHTQYQDREQNPMFYNNHIDYDEPKSKKNIIYTIFFSSEKCKYSKLLQKFLDNNMKLFQDDDQVVVYDIIMLCKKDVPLPDYLENVPALVISEDDGNEQNVVDDGIIYGVDKIIPILEQRLKEVKKNNANGANWFKNIPKPKNRKQAQAFEGVNPFAISCGRQSKSADLPFPQGAIETTASSKKNVKGSIDKALQEYVETSKELGIDEPTVGNYKTPEKKETHGTTKGTPKGAIRPAGSSKGNFRTVGVAQKKKGTFEAYNT